MLKHLQQLEKYKNQGKIPEELATVIDHFFLSYAKAIGKNGYDVGDLQTTLSLYLDLISEQLANPFPFDLFHQRITTPVNYYHFGLDLLRPLVDFKHSKVVGLDHVDAIQYQLDRRENVILFANHQTEPDPQAISLLLEKTHPQLAEEMIFVAGHRVITDPLAVPLSKGRNLLCIFSKRYIEIPPEDKQEKLLHNQKTMKKMAQLLSEGGKCIYVAPSGGRDRPHPDHGAIEVAPFDPQSIEMFWLMAKHANTPTHFYPLALATYDLLPPPHSIEQDLGEQRHTECTPIHLSFGDEVDMEGCISKEITDKKERRQQRADYIWGIVARNYAFLTNPSHD